MVYLCFGTYCCHYLSCNFLIFNTSYWLTSLSILAWILTIKFMNSFPLYFPLPYLNIGVYVNTSLYWSERECVCVCVCVYVFSHRVVSDSLWPHGLKPTSSSVFGVFQARRILEWVSIFSSRGSSQPRDWTCISSIGFTTEPPGKPKVSTCFLPNKGLSGVVCIEQYNQKTHIYSKLPVALNWDILKVIFHPVLFSSF